MKHPSTTGRVAELPHNHLAVTAFYRLSTGLMALVLRVFGRWRVTGAERMPRSGPLIVVSNHLNNADPPLLGASLPRRINFMAKQELHDLPVAGITVALFGAFPVRRSQADLRALRTAQRLLSEGRAVGMFPEGHRSKGGGMIKAQPGTALLALRSGAPVLPVAITGTERIHSLRILLQRPSITVTVGEPFVLKLDGRITSEQVGAATEQIMQRIAEMLPPAYQGVYGRR